MSTSQLRLHRLHVRDFRCFASLEVAFHDQLTVLVAANGAGKTSVLDAVAVALGPFLGAFDESVGRHFQPSDIRQIRVRETAALEMEYAPKGVWLEAEGTVPDSGADLAGERVRWRRALAGPAKARTTVKDAKVLTGYGKRLQEAVRTPGTDVTLPLLAYYGTGRLWQQKKLMEGKLPRSSRTIGYTDCLDPASSYRSFVAWFRYWNLNAKEGRLRALEQGLAHAPTEFDAYIDAVAGAVNTCLAPSSWRDISYSFSADSLVAHHPDHGQLPVELLSDGIRNMIGMVADMAFRAVKLNPQLGAKAAEQTPGVVLIDEVDMHLHPEWQQTVLQGLRGAFPSVQFIVTTHSPQVLSTVDKACVRLLGVNAAGDTVATEPLANPYGVPSGTVLQQVMHVDPQPPVAELPDLKRLTALVDQGHYEAAEAAALMAALTARLGPTHEQIARLQRSMTRQRALGQAGGAGGTRE
jgi:predicted ATP-binding protein involved in virulence